MAKSGKGSGDPLSSGKGHGLLPPSQRKAGPSGSVDYSVNDTQVRPSDPLVGAGARGSTMPKVEDGKLDPFFKPGKLTDCNKC